MRITSSTSSFFFPVVRKKHLSPFFSLDVFLSPFPPPFPSKSHLVQSFPPLAPPPLPPMSDQKTLPSSSPLPPEFDFPLPFSFSPFSPNYRRNRSWFFTSPFFFSMRKWDYLFPPFFSNIVSFSPPFSSLLSFRG